MAFLLAQPQQICQLCLKLSRLVGLKFLWVQPTVIYTSAYEKIGTLAQMNPPLRSPHDNEVLWQALLDGVIDFIATDHAPHTLEEKAQTYLNSPSGMPGVETSLPLMLTQAVQGRCTVVQVANWMSTAVAKAYEIPKKGAINPGYDADLVLVDLDNYHSVLREEVLSKCGWNPFEGWNLNRIQLDIRLLLSFLVI